MARQRKVFRGRKRNSLQRLKTSLERVIQMDLRAAQAAADTNDTSHLTFQTVGSLNKANAVLQAVEDALTR